MFLIFHNLYFISDLGFKKRIIYFLSKFLTHWVKKISKNKSLESSLKEMRFHVKYLNEEFPNIFTFALKQTLFSTDKMYLIPKHSESSSINETKQKFWTSFKSMNPIVIQLNYTFDNCLILQLILQCFDVTLESY